MNLGAGVAPENYSPSADHETPLPQAHTGEPRDAEGTPAWLREIQPADQVSSKVTTHRLVKILAVVCTVGLLGCLAVGVCFLVKLLLRPATNHSSAGLGDAKETPFCNVTEDSTIADPRKVFYRISPENSLLEVQLEKLQTWLPVCYERWNSSLGNLVCRQLGYLRLTKHKGVNLTDIGPNYSDGFVQITSEHKTNLESLWQFRGESHVLSCPLNTMETNIRPDPVSHWAWRELYHRKGDSTEVFRVWDSSKAAPNNWRNGSHSGEVALASESPLQLQTYLRRLNYNAPLDSHRCTLRTQHGINLYLSLYVHFRDKTCLAFYPLHYRLPQVSSWVVLAGVVTRSSTKLAQHTGYAVEKILYHKNYNHRSHDNDIALIKLKTPLNFTDTIRPVCLPQYDHDFPGGTRCWISGWGYTRPDEVHIPETLKEASVPLISTKKCNSSCMYDGEITSRMLCAGYTEGQVDACQGDSGGPLVCQDDGVWRLVGVVSWGTGCAEPNHPGVYTKVAEFLGWIYDTIENY